MKIRSVFPFIVLGILWACKPSPAKTKISPNSKGYARFFEVKQVAGVKILKIKKGYPGSPSYQYILTTKKRIDTTSGGIPVSVPVERYVATSVTHLDMLRQLGVIDGLVAFPHTNYIADPELLSRVKQGKIKDLGSEQHLNTEWVLKLKPELIFTFSSGEDRKDYGFFQKYGIIPVYIAEWMETDPLGRAEWIKVFGAFFNKDSLAAKIFQNIVFHYDSIKKLSRHTKRKPKVFQGGKYGDKWYVPGGKSWAAQLINDAGGQYLITNEETGSIVISQEDALRLLTQADIWFNPGNWQNIEQVRKNFPQAVELNVFKNRQIYSAYIKTNSAGKNEFFEKSVLHPHWLLKDYYHIFNRENNASFYFMEKLK